MLCFVTESLEQLIRAAIHSLRCLIADLEPTYHRSQRAGARMKSREGGKGHLLCWSGDVDQVISRSHSNAGDLQKRESHELSMFSCICNRLIMLRNPFGLLLQKPVGRGDHEQRKEGGGNQSEDQRPPKTGKDGVKGDGNR